MCKQEILVDKSNWTSSKLYISIVVSEKEVFLKIHLLFDLGKYKVGYTFIFLRLCFILSLFFAL